MIGAIIALVGAAVNLISGALQSGAQKYAQRNAEYETAIQFERDKETALYSSYASQKQTIAIILVIGVIGLVFLAYFLHKNAKK